MRIDRLGDDNLIRHVARRFAVQTAAAVAAVVVLATFVTYALDVRGHLHAAERAVENATRVADDVTDPPPGVVLIEQRTGHRPRLSRNAPASMRRVRPVALGPGRATVTVRGHRYVAFTVDRRDGARMTALFDLDRGHEEEMRLLGALVVGGMIGIAAAALVGWVIGHRAVRPLGQALALQRSFVADASHELRTPLTAIHTRVQLLQRRTETSDDATRAHVAQLVKDTGALSEVLGDLLISAELRHHPGRRQPVDLRALADEVADSMRLRASELGMDVSVRGAAECSVAGSRPALRRAVSALVDNALAHNRPGGKVDVDVRREGGHALLVVSDDGDGVDPERIDELTRRFARGTDDAGHGRRFGLGLALVREVVHAHDAELRIARNATGGSSFTLAFPLGGEGSA
ncbi:MAG TPA: HAMP domain-containing sensor histidine kinase [Actinopolymorphaceae bacterium]|nr:HAMP domain-containing sensor histidine kinase [Actinopolymorphaceae bacterium]